MNRFPIYLLSGFALALSSCADWTWDKLNPLHLDSELDTKHEAIMQNLPDGRDFSGYHIPGSKKKEEKKVSKQNSDDQLPIGTPTNKPRQVISPYPPHKVLDTMGYPAGTIVKDPETNRSFKLP